MKLTFTILLVAYLSMVGRAAQAQYTFTADNLSPYQQNFNSLSGAVTMKADATGQASYMVSLPEVFAQADLGTSTAPNPISPTSVGANDGSSGTANYYHFGYADETGTDRSFGGVASFSTTGVGHVGVRLKNSSGKTIKNLEIQYAMEQWYNSGRQDQAQLTVSYKTSTSAIKSLLGAVGTGTTDWKAVPDLAVDAPSTTTALLGRDGNATSNRRVRQTTLTGLNLADGQEIMIRWTYALSNNTNGNGLSIDDVVVTPETNIFYSKTTGSLDDPATWGVNTDGSGGGVASFATDNAVYYVLGNTAKADRIKVGTTWTVSGANSKIIVGTAASAANLYIEFNKNINGKLDVSNGSTLYIRRTPTNGPIGFSLNALGATSTVQYDSKSSAHTILAANYGNLRLSDVGEKVLGSNLIISGNLDLSNTASLKLGNYSVTLVRGGAIVNSSSSCYIITNGTGTLRQSVPNSGADVLYPVGAAASSYTPILLQ